MAAYDPRLRKMRGVYYTHRAVVSYIVRSVDRLLHTRLGLADGLAARTPLILDPAAGTGTFLREVIAIIREKIEAKG